MTKLYILTFLIVAFVYIAKAQVDTNEFADQIEEKTLAILNNRVTGLPETLQPSGNEIIRKATEGLKVCRNGFNFMQIIWAYNLCTTKELKIASIALSFLESSAISGA